MNSIYLIKISSAIVLTDTDSDLISKYVYTKPKNYTAVVVN